MASQTVEASLFYPIWFVRQILCVCVFACLSPHNVNMACCHMLLQREERAREREQEKKKCV